MSLSSTYNPPWVKGMGLIKRALSGKAYVPQSKKQDGKVELIILDCRDSGLYVKAVAMIKTKDGKWKMMGDSPSTGIMLDIDPDLLPREEVETDYGTFETIKLPLKAKARPETPVRFKDVEILGEVSLEELDQILGENIEGIISARGIVENGVLKFISNDNKETIIFPSRSTEGGKKLEMLTGKEVLVIGGLASALELRDTRRYKLKWTLPIVIEETEKEENIESPQEEKEKQEENQKEEELPTEIEV